MTFLAGMPRVRSINAKVLEYSSQDPILASSSNHLEMSLGPSVACEARLNPDPVDDHRNCTVEFPLVRKSDTASILSHAEKAPDDDTTWLVIAMVRFVSSFVGKSKA